MCDSIANGGPRASVAQQCCPPANVIIASNVLDTTGNVIAGNVIAVDGTFTGNLYVAGSIVSNISYSALNVSGAINASSFWGSAYYGNGYGLSSINTSNLLGTISNTNLGVTGVTPGTYGSFANVAQVTVDQYGLVTGASNVAILSSQWTSVAGNVAYQNGVSVGTLSAPPVGSNLYVLGSANITDTLNVSTLYVNSAVVYGSATMNVWGVSNLSTTLASLYIGNGSGLSNLNASNLVGNVAAANVALVVSQPSQPNVTSLGTLTGLTISGLLVASNGSGISNLNPANISGNVVAANVALVVTQPSQPNITSVGTLTSLNVSGISNLNSITGNGFGISNLNPANISGNVVAANVALVVTQPSQPNITSVGTLTSLTVSGAITGSLFSGNGSAISNINSSNLVGNVANANVALVVSQPFQPNITQVGTLTGLFSSGNVTASFFIGGGNTLSNVQVANLTGTVNFANTAGSVTAAAQPNITSLGTLTGLYSTGNLTASFFIGGGNALSNIQTGSLVGVPNYANTAGVVVNPAQPNITSVGALTSLLVIGSLTAGTISGDGQGLYGIHGSSIIDTVATANSVVQSAQPNITSVGQLTSLTVAGLLVASNGSGISNLNSSNLTGTVPLTVFPTSGVTAGLYGSGANVSSVTVDQYGRVTGASNVAVTASQWTSATGNTIYYSNSVGIGAVTVPTATLMVTGNAYVSNSVTTPNIFFTNQIQATNLPTSDVTAGGYGSVANIPQLTVDQYGRLTSASNISLPSLSQWTSIDANVAFGNGVSIGTLTNPPTGSNLYVLGTANISATLNVPSLVVGTLANLVSANITTANIASANLTIANVVTANLITANVTNLRVQTQANLVSANITTANVATANLTTANITTSNILTANVTNLRVQTLANLVSANITTGNIASANLTVANVVTANIITGNLVSANATNLVVTGQENVATLNVSTQFVVSGAMNVVPGNVTMFFDTLLIPFVNVTSNLTVSGQANLVSSNLVTANVGTLNTASILATNSNLLSANVSLANIQTLNGVSIFGTLANLTTLNVLTENVLTLNAVSIFGTNSNLLSANVGTLNAVSIFGTNSNLLSANVGTLNAVSIFGTNSNLLSANVGTLNAASIFGTSSNLLVANAVSIFGTNSNLLSANVVTGNVGTLNAVSFFGTTSNLLVANVVTENVTTLNALSLFGTISNLLAANVVTGNVGTLNAVSFFGTTSNLLVANVVTENVTTLNALSLFGTTSNLLAANVVTGNVGTLNAVSIFGTNSNLATLNAVSIFGTNSNLVTLNAVSFFGTTSNLLVANVVTENVMTLNAVSLFGAAVNVVNLNALSAFITTENVVTLNAASIFGTNLNVGAVSNLTNLVVTSNILAGPSGNTYITGNVVVSGNVFSALGTPLGSGGGYYFSLPSDIALQTPYTGALYGATYPLSVGLSNGFTINGTSTLITVTPNGNFQFSVAGPYLLRAVFNSTDNITGLAVGSNVADVHGTDQGYMYRYTTFITQNPTELIEIPFNVTDTSKYYYLDLFSIDGGSLHQTANTSGGTYLTITPLTGGGLATGGPGGTPGTQWISSGSNIYYANSVGIGAINPQYNLDVSTGTTASKFMLVSNVSSLGGPTLNITSNVQISANLAVGGAIPYVSPPYALYVQGQGYFSGHVSYDNFSGYRNRLINGTFRIAARANTLTVSNTSVFSLSNAFVMDRWYADVGNLSTSNVAMTIKQDVAVGQTNGFSNVANVYVTRAFGSTLDNTWICPLVQTVEASGVYDLRLGQSTAKPMVLSFYANAAVTGNYSVVLRSKADNTYFANLVTLTNSWDRYTVYLPACTIGTWGTGLNGSIEVCLCGVSFGTGRANVAPTTNWTASPGYAPVACTGAVNWMTSAPSRLQVTGVQLELGTITTPFEIRLLSETTRLCQRYFETNPETQYAAALGSGRVNSIPFVVTKRNHANVTVYRDLANLTANTNVSQFVAYYGDGALKGTQAINSYIGSEYGFTFNFTNTGSKFMDGSIMEAQFVWKADSEIY
jgi:uncharacterized protein YjbI with pentapeptide repeats